MQRSQRFIADQRFDLPQYEQMLGFISEEFNKLNSDFISTKNYIVKNWKVEDAGGLICRVNVADDSILLNSERIGYEILNFRDQSLPQLTLALDDNATNYVEVEMYSGTTGNDSVAIWDQSANSGDGEEFIQNVDTVNCEDTKLVSNTIQFSISAPHRMPLAIVVTSAGSIISVTDARKFFYNLATDWDFDGSAFSTVRTDKTIATLKNMYDALATSLKELKDTPNWYDDPGISPIDILERLNYMLVEGGDITWNMPKAAKGHLIAHSSDPAFGVKDGDTFALSDGVLTKTFEFDDNASVVGSNIPVTILAEDTALNNKTAIINAINGSGLSIVASSGTDARIELTNTVIGTAGNVLTTESMSNGSSLFPHGMTGGFDNNELTWTALLKIVAPSRAYNYEISSQTISNVADQEVVYVTLPLQGTTPPGPLSVSKVDKASYALNFANTRNYIIAYRSGSKIYFGNGWSNVELEDGETNQLGDGITGQWLTATGLVDEFDDTPPYFSTHWISPDASFTKAISQHDQIIESIYNMVVGIPYDEFVVLAVDTPALTYITLPPPFGVGSPQTYQTSHNQLEIYFNGRKQDEGFDFFEDANIGAGVGNRIRTAYDLPKDCKITFRIQIGGGQDGTISVDAPDVYLENSLIQSAVGKINFRDQVEVTQVAPGEIDIRIRRPRESGRRCKNNTAFTIAAGKAVCWLNDGSIELADASTVSLSDFVGITADAILSGGVGFVYRSGLVPGVVSATPGTPVYLDTVAGALTLTPPSGLGDTVLRLGRAEPSDGMDGTGTDLWLHPEVIAEP